MSKWVVDIHGDIEGDYEIIKEYAEPKTGHWIFYDECKEHGHCSKCGYYTDLMDGRSHNYCPNCGSRNEEEDDG